MNLIKKVSIILLCIMAFSFYSPKETHAVDWAGKLVSPIVDFVVFLGDGTMDLVHNVILGQETSVIRVDLTESTGETIAKWLLVIGGAIVGVVLTIATAGLATAAFAAIRSYIICCIGWCRCCKCCGWWCYRLCICI